MTITSECFLLIYYGSGGERETIPVGNERQEPVRIIKPDLLCLGIWGKVSVLEASDVLSHL